jgi:methionyl-tRNA formyltransferase
MVRALAALERGSLVLTPQPDAGMTYAAKLTNGDAQVDWALPAGRVHDLIRGLSPFPGAWATIDLGRGPERVKLLRSARGEGAGPPGTLLDEAGTVACGAGAVRLLQVQRAGKGVMAFADFARGARLAPGARFG